MAVTAATAAVSSGTPYPLAPRPLLPLLLLLLSPLRAFGAPA